MARIHEMRLSALASGRIYAGIAIALISCVCLAYNQGMLQLFFNIGAAAIFPIFGLAWGLLITWFYLPQRRLAVGNSLNQSTPKSRLFSVNSKVNHSQNGILYFSIIGSVAYLIAVFQTLDNQDVTQINLHRLFGTLFLGLFLWAVLESLEATRSSTASKETKRQVHRNVSISDMSWYLLASGCVICCNSLVFFFLT